MKRLFIIHGWGGNPSEPLFAWLKTEAEKLGFEIKVPAMPGTETPTIGAWVNTVRDTAEYIDENTFFIGHSIGAQAILRYLQEPDGINLGGVVFIAPWMTVTGLESDEERSVARPWMENPIDFTKVKQYLKTTVAIFSDNDAFVPLAENSEFFTKALAPEVIVESGKGHFNEGNGVVELPSALDALKRVAKV
jgi:uncharacterized protein